MKNHWDQHLNVRELMLERRPKLVVECGGGGGDNTTQILTLKEQLGFRLVVINDGDAPEGIELPGAEWICGLSFLELPNFADGAIDFCSIDTDHNYPTMKRELDALRPKMRQGGVVVMHDTVTFAKNNGRMHGYYRIKYPYLSEEINAAVSAGKGMIDAIHESLDAFKVLRVSEESEGAMALERL